MSGNAVAYTATPTLSSGTPYPPELRCLTANATLLRRKPLQVRAVADDHGGQNQSGNANGD